MAEIAEFTGRTTQNHRVIYFCNNCHSRSFKFIMEGASREIIVECAACENVQTWLTVQHVDES